MGLGEMLHTVDGLSVRDDEINSIWFEDPLDFFEHPGRIDVGAVGAQQGIDGRLIDDNVED